MIAYLLPAYRTACDGCERVRLCRELLRATNQGWRRGYECSECRKSAQITAQTERIAS